MKQLVFRRMCCRPDQLSLLTFTASSVEFFVFQTHCISRKEYMQKSIINVHYNRVHRVHE